MHVNVQSPKVLMYLQCQLTRKIRGQRDKTSKKKVTDLNPTMCVTDVIAEVSTIKMNELTYKYFFYVQMCCTTAGLAVQC